MTSQEMPITITPQQAAHGVILPVQLPSGPARLRIPSCRDGDLVRARVGDQELLLRIQVSGAGAQWIAGAGGIRPPAWVAARNGGTAGSPSAGGSTAATSAMPAAGAGSRPPGRSPGASGRGCLVAVLVAAAVAIGGIVLVNSGDEGDSGASPDAKPTWSSSWTPTPSASSEPGAVTTPSTAPTPYSPEASAEPSPEPSSEPSPFDRGTCLNGQLPDSTTPQSVSGVEEVPCSASDAHYRVIESIPGTSDMDRCNANPKTQYAFSYRYMRGALVLNQYVYCLVGLGSYAR
ncbi:LppU/SCO3897 family protein [Streptomyces sp. NPDC054849]